MKRSILVALGIGAVVSSAAAFSVGAGHESDANLTHTQYVAKMRAIDTSRVAGVAACKAKSGIERDFCRVEIDAEQAVRSADAEAAYRRTQQASRSAQRARIEARYQVDRARCAILGGLKRDKCMVQVHADRGRAMLDAASPYGVRS